MEEKKPVFTQENFKSNVKKQLMINMPELKVKFYGVVRDKDGNIKHD